VCLKLSLLELL